MVKEGTELMKGQGDKNEALGYKVYLEERNLLVDAAREGARSFDKAILTLSAGTFGLSLAFIKQIASVIQPGALCFLLASWTFLALSMLMTLISFLTSQSACTRQIEILEAANQN
jgi:hypothetical protein